MTIKVETFDYATRHGFVITPRSSRGYTITHPRIEGLSMTADNYEIALNRMQNTPVDGGNPVAIDAAGKSVAVIQGEFDAMVTRADGGLADLVAPVWRQPIAERLKLDDLPTLAERKTVSRDPREFRVTVRFKGGERKTYACRDREHAFETAAFQLTGRLVKSIKLEPM